MPDLIRTNSDNTDFQALVSLLDADLRIRDGADNLFYAQFNKLDNIRNVVVAYNGDIAVGCGAFKKYEDDTVEIKRMYVKPEWRGQRIAANVLSELESWAAELNYSACVLGTGLKQPEAVRLYERSGYQRIPNYGQYSGVDNSVCMKKTIN